MKKTILGVFRLLFMLGFGFFYFFTILKPDITIDRYDAVVTVNDSGDMTVVETWDMTYHEEMRVRFRDIGYSKYPVGYPIPISTPNKASIDETSVNVRFFKDNEDRTSIIRVADSFTDERDELGYLIVCEPDVRYCDSLFVDAFDAGGLEGDVTFIYTYTIVGAVTQYSDISELNWRLFEYAEATVQNARVEINLPINAYEKEALLAWGHGTTGNVEIPSNHQVILEMKNIKSGEFPEFRILAENSLFPNIHSDNVFLTNSVNKSIIIDYENVLTEQTNARIRIANFVFIAALAMIAVMGLLTYLVYKKYDKEYTPQFQGDYYRELPNDDTPAFVSYLTYMRKITDEVVPATLLDLIRRKYILLDYSGSDMSSKESNFKFSLNPEQDQAKLLSFERNFISWIFKIVGNGQEVTSKQIESYGKGDVEKAKRFQSAAKSFVKSAERDASKKKYFEAGLELKKSKVMVAVLIPIGVLVISLYTGFYYNLNNWISIIISVVIMIAYMAYVNQIKKRSVEGNELYTKWMAFKNFLLDFSKMDDYPIPGIIIWEHYLVYATIFKIADKVTDQLSVKLPAEELENNQSTYMRSSRFSRGIYYNSLLHNVNTSFSIAKMNSNSTIVAANVAKFGSSGSGSGGGFGGGSSFGGGGGGGRSR